MAKSLIKFIPPPNSISLPDEGQYKLRLKIPNSDGTRYYMVAFLAGPNSNYFVCSCMGCLRFGKCKHLSAMGLWGRNNRDMALNKAREIGLIK